MLAEQPSSSSISTTTSSVTSMTSLEQEESKGADSVSDYDDTWDTENWGEMDVSILTLCVHVVVLLSGVSFYPKFSLVIFIHCVSFLK